MVLLNPVGQVPKGGVRRLMPFEGLLAYVYLFIIFWICMPLFVATGTPKPAHSIYNNTTTLKTDIILKYHPKNHNNKTA